MYCNRDFLDYAEALYLKVVILCTLFCLSTCEPCSMNELQNPAEYNECGSYKNNLNSGIQNAFAGDFSQEIVSGNLMPQLSLENVCRRSDLFCFPSTLSGFFSEVLNAESTVLELSRVQQVKNNFSWPSKHGSFKLLSGSVVSCSLNLEEGISDMSYCQIDGNDQNGVSSFKGPSLNSKTPGFDQNEDPVKIKSGISDDSLSLHVEISPPLLDWGQKYLYFPSVAFLTVENTHSHSVLNIYGPYNTNTQFYPCNFSEMMLGPGEVATICFVFLPTWLGSSSAQLILQTSSGGFLIQARGFAIESPYEIQPLVGLDYSSGGRWSKNISLFNPFEETLYVKEVSAWISFSSGDTSHSTKAVCSVKNPEGFADSITFYVDSGQIAMRPHRTWEVGPKSNEAILELDFSYHSQGKILGSFCVQLLRASKDKVDTVMVPLEAEVGGSSTEYLNSSLSISLEALMPCDANGTVFVALLMENAAPYVLTVAKISGTRGNTELFQIKYVEGLILFPGTVTQAAVVAYTPFANQLHDMNLNCKLLVQTNESSTPQIEIPCSDIVGICSRHASDSYVGYAPQDKESDCGNEETRSLYSSVRPPLEIMAMEMAEADELVLENWRSQGTVNDMSVLDDHEVVFPFVHVGNHQSKYITVKNPSDKPVAMQLILNSGEIIDECRESDGVLQPSSSSNFVHNDYTNPSRYGFSVGDRALTEAYVHPHGRASLGPIVFHPSSRCAWKSSALVRNNLSGVEWLSLRGFGGSLSLLLFDGSDPVKIVEFNHSLPEILSDVDDSTHACAQPSLKELYAKNAGDLPLEVKKIEVSGTECELDGFVVHTCKSFALEPGESTKLLVSYRADFSAAIVQRDLELALAGGILVIPMKASLPTSMLMICKTSHLWIRVKKSSFIAILLAGFMLFLVFYWVIPQVTPFGSQDPLYRNGKSFIATIRHAENLSRVHRNQKNGSKFSMATNMNGLVRSIGEGEKVMLESIRRYPDNSSGVSQEPEKTSQCVNGTVPRVQTCSHDNTKKEVVARSSSSLLSKSMEVERSASQEEASQPGNLTVKTGKEKGRRRRKKKSSANGLTGQFEFSSSQSGNSSPLSPLSPLSSLTPNRSRALSPDVKQQRVETRNPFGNAPEKSTSLFFPTKEKKPSVPGKTVSKPVLLPSATFPCTGRSALMCPSPILASTPTIVPYARAPGSKLYEQKVVKAQEKKGNEDEFKYDIWGDHLFGLCFTGVSKNVSVMSPLATQSNSDSFFVRGPQSLVTNSQAKVVSSNQDG